MSTDGELPPVSRLDDYRSRPVQEEFSPLTDILSTTPLDREHQDKIHSALKKAIIDGIDSDATMIVVRALELLSIIDPLDHLMAQPGKLRPSIPHERIDLLKEIMQRLKATLRVYNFWNLSGGETLVQSELQTLYGNIYADTEESASEFPLIKILLKLAEDRDLAEHPEVKAARCIGVMLVEWFAEQEYDM